MQIATNHARKEILQIMHKVFHDRRNAPLAAQFQKRFLAPIFWSNAG